MRAARLLRPASTALLALAGLGCGVESPSGVEPPSEFDLVGTVWRSDPLPGEATAPGCLTFTRNITFLPEGEISYESKCDDPNDEWRSYYRPDDWWRVDGDQVFISYSNGFKTCEGRIDPKVIRFQCQRDGQPNEDVFIRSE
jgi:hypothetical protein